MPFKSDKQKRWMYANKPAMAKRWSAEEASGNYSKGGKTKKLKKGGRTDAGPKRTTAYKAGVGSIDESGKVVGRSHQEVHGGSTTKTTKHTPTAKKNKIPVIGPISWGFNKVLQTIDPVIKAHNKKKRTEYAIKEGLTRDWAKTHQWSKNPTLDVMSKTGKNYLKDAGYKPFQDKDPKTGGDNELLCPDGTKPPCVTKQQGTAAPQQQPEKKKGFLDDFQAYKKGKMVYKRMGIGGGVRFGPPPLRGPNPHVPPVKLKTGSKKGYKYSCPHREDGIRGVGKAIRGHKFTGVK
tara:strand:+ start:4803 stop:5678 length:876 start_codon:yes stop_codon:yes gene_type:complete